MAKGDYKIPFDGKGNMLHYPEQYLMSPNPEWSPSVKPGEWRDNEPFEATLTFDGWGRGRSAAYFYWKDEEGRRYPMFMSDLAALIESDVLEYGVVRDGMWSGVKRGMNYGLHKAERI